MRAALALLLFASFANAATYYVSTTGNDTNPGSAGSRWLTFTKAAATAVAGDTVLFGSGTYGKLGAVSPAYAVTLTASGSAGNPITFQSETRGGAILDSENTTTDDTCDGAAAYINFVSTSYIVIDGFKIRRGCLEGLHSNDAAHHITIKNNEIYEIANRTTTTLLGLDGIYINAANHHWTFDSNSWHGIGRVNSDILDHAIYSAADDVTIINNLFYNLTRGWGVQLANSSSNVDIYNNTFYGTMAQDGQIMLWDTITGLAIKNNVFYSPNNYALTRFTATLSSCSITHNLTYGVSSMMASSTGCTVGSNLLNVDPLMVTPGSDFKLRAGSPARDAGVYSSLVPLDYDGTTRSLTSNDMGAYVIPAGGVTVSVCASGCTTTSLQTALTSAAACGDTIEIKSTEIQTGSFTFTNRGCTTSNPITVTSDRAAWLPFVGTRITPSHLANMATIRTTSSGTIPLSGVLDGSSLPANNWTFVGIAFTTTGTTNYYLVQTKSQSYTAANASQLPHDISFDRCYFYMGLPNAAGTSLSQAIWLDGTTVSVKNSFFGDIADLTGNEAHPIFTLNTPGPLTVENNYITNSSTSLFAGGDPFPDIPGSVPTNISFRYNYTYLPWKWNNDPAQPYYADYAANGGGALTICKKNHGEFKFGDGITWKYNVHENMWDQTQCNGQAFGYTATVRNALVSSFYTSGLGQITFSSSTAATWTGTYTILTNPAGLDSGACIDIGGATGLECHAIASINVPGKSLVLNTPLSSTPAGAVHWYYTYEASGYLANLTQTNNVYKNVALGTNNLGTTPGNGVGNSGKLFNVNVSNNLYWNPSTYTSTVNNIWWKATAAEEGYNFNPTGYTNTHNTLYSASTAGKWLDFNSSQGWTFHLQPKWNLLDWSNNLAGPSATYPVAGQSTTGNLDLTFSTYMSNASFKNNGLPGVSTSTCTGTNTCSGNIATAWADPFVNSTAGLFVVKPGNATYGKAATDGYDVGANFAALPLIKNLRTTVAQRVALLEFDLSGPIQLAGSTQPCVLEVSTSRNLHSDLNTYTVINALRPDYFYRPDSTTGANPLLPLPVVSNGHVFWPIGFNGSVVGDDTVSHDLSLAAATLYYGRVQCYGDTQLFSFTTAASATSAIAFDVSQKVAAAYDIYRIAYGASTAFGSTVDATPNGGTRIATATVPMVANTFVYWRPLFRASGSTLYTGPTRILLQ